MNIQALQTSIDAPNPTRIGGRLDIRSDAPAPAHNARSAGTLVPQTGTPAPEVLRDAGLLGILNAQEQFALAAIFGEATPTVYTGRGHAVSDQPVVGTRLDLEA